MEEGFWTEQLLFEEKLGFLNFDPFCGVITYIRGYTYFLSREEKTTADEVPSDLIFERVAYGGQIMSTP